MLPSIGRSVRNEYQLAFDGYAAFGATLTLFAAVHAVANKAPEFLVSYMVECGKDNDIYANNVCQVSEHAADIVVASIAMYGIVIPLVSSAWLLIKAACCCSPCKTSKSMLAEDLLGQQKDENAQERQDLLQQEKRLTSELKLQVNSEKQKQLDAVKAKLEAIGRVSTAALDSDRQSFVLLEDPVGTKICNRLKNTWEALPGFLRFENLLHAGTAIAVAAACLLSKDIQNKFGMDNAAGVALADVSVGFAVLGSIIATRKLFVRPPLRILASHCCNEYISSWFVQSSKEEAVRLADAQGHAYLSSDIELDSDIELHSDIESGEPNHRDKHGERRSRLFCC